ncbi:MAG: phage major capsid protein [Oscillospiraceae bacterium]|nr:phage major capsid protein [Oscillospiraceae bacterium]
MKDYVKKITELNMLILAASEKAKEYLSQENKDIEKATQELDKAESLEKEKNVYEKLIQREKKEAAEKMNQIPQPVSTSEKAFADAFRAGFPIHKNANESTPADGGYTVPEDIRTKVEQYRDAKFSLRKLVDVENVTTKSGRRTFQKRAQQSPFSKIGEGSKFGKRTTPQFEIMTYDVAKYGGYLPVTNELLADSDANINKILVEWLGDTSRVTDNYLILEALNTKEITTFTSLDELKHEIIVTLGQAFADTSSIITNDDGLFWLDTLKDSEGRYLLKSDPTGVLPNRLAIGTKLIPLIVVPNMDLPTENEYSATEDTTVKVDTTYYTRSGSGTAESPYKYTKVENPAGNPKTSNYYVVSALLVPMITGDIKEAVKLFDRKTLQLKLSDIAAVGSGDDQLNAYEEDLTLIRALERLDVKIKDSQAYVNCRLKLDAYN